MKLLKFTNYLVFSKIPKEIKFVIIICTYVCLYIHTYNCNSTYIYDTNIYRKMRNANVIEILSRKLMNSYS